MSPILTRAEIVEHAAIFLEVRTWEEMGELLADIIIQAHIEKPELVASFLTGTDSPHGSSLPAPWLHVHNVMERRLIEFPGVATG